MEKKRNPVQPTSRVRWARTGRVQPHHCTACSLLLCLVPFPLMRKQEGSKNHFIFSCWEDVKEGPESLSPYLMTLPQACQHRRILAVSGEGDTEPFRTGAWLSLWNPHCYWKSDAASYKSPSTSSEEADLMHLAASGTSFSVFWYSIAKHSWNHSAML